MRHLVLVAALLAGAAQGAAIDVQALKTDTKVLSSDAFEGRKPGTPGETKTVAYLIGRMKAAGLQPGNHGSWTQDVPLVAITANPKTAVLNFGGGAGGLVKLGTPADAVIWTGREQTHVAVQDSPAVFVGYGINAPEKGWNDYAGVDVRGKTVVILINDPDWREPTTKGLFDGRAMTYYGRWTYKYEEAARQGAAAALIVHQTEPAAYPFEVVQNSNTGAKLSIATPDKGASRSTIEGWITLDAAQRLMRSAGEDFAALEAAAGKQGFRAVPLTLQATASLDNTVSYAASKNVIGILPGAKRPDEVVLFTGHWDHFGHCPPSPSNPKDDICNGAVDNASGSAGVLSLARAFAAGPRPARSLVFINVTGEEQGLLGSRYYAEHPVYPLAKTIGGVNMDGLNVTGLSRDVIVTGGPRNGVDALFTAAAAAQGRTVSPEANPEKGYYFRSDHFMFAKVGVPMLDAESGIDKVNGGKVRGQALADDYTAHRYHKPQDEYDPSWDWSGAVQDLSAYYTVGLDLANGTAFPQWRDGSEFKAARDKALAAR